MHSSITPCFFIPSHQPKVVSQHIGGISLRIDYFSNPKSHIMNYKTKSLLYFCGFVAASALYYVVEQHDNFQEHLNSKSYVETQFEDADDYVDDSEKKLEEEIK